MEPASTLAPEQQMEAWPDHTQLPDKDGAMASNFQEHPQSTLLTGSLRPLLHELHPDGQFCIGCDSGIYWRYTTPPLDGYKAPDWFYVPDVPPMLEGQFRRSYVLWKELIHPTLLIEYVSGDGSEEHDQTPWKGKFWIYERVIAASYYAIFDGIRNSVELYRLDGGRYVQVAANAAGRLPVPPLGIELGIWHGVYQGMEMPWLRAWDSRTALMLPSTEERELAQTQRADQEKERADKEKERADETGLLLDETRGLLQEETERAEAERKRAATAEEKMLRLAEKLRALGQDPDAA
jgi:Uma2 family endonuclease